MKNETDKAKDRAIKEADLLERQQELVGKPELVEI